MIFYIGIISFLILFSIGSIRNIEQKTLLKISLFLLGMLATFRSLEIGNDTKNYYELYQNICLSHNFQSLTWRYEIGYLWLNNVISYITNNFTVFLGIINCFIYIVYYFFIKKYSKNYMMSVFLFFTLGIWGNTLNIIRLELAIAIALLSFMVLDSGKVNKFLGVGFTLVPVIFQRISIVYLLGIFTPKSINKKFLRTSFIIAIISTFLLPLILTYVGEFVPYFSEFYLQTGSMYSINNIKLASVMNMLMAMMVFLFGFIIYKNHNRKYNQSNDISLQINMVWISFLILMVSLRFNLIDRCSYFFWTFSIIMIPNALSCIESIPNRKILKFIIILLCVVYFFMTTIYRPEWNCIYPYRLIF